MEAAFGRHFNDRETRWSETGCEPSVARWKDRADGLRPIRADGLDEALPLLQRGFPERDGAFWQNGFARLGTSRRDGPIGHLLGIGGRDVGVLLTFRTERVRADGTRTAMVNLAGWYIDPEHRWRAPMMLRRVLAEPDATFTDLTPSESVERINTALGFTPWNEGQVVTPLPPWAAMPVRAGVTVYAAETDAAVVGDDLDLVERHAAMGCLAAVLRDGGEATPLLFKVARRKGVRCARLVYAHSRRAVLANRAAIARFLVPYGVLVLTVDADRADCPRGSVFREGRRNFLKGGRDRDRIDYAFSELALLDFDASPQS